MISIYLGEKLDEKVFLFWRLLQVLPIFSRNFWAFRRKKMGAVLSKPFFKCPAKISRERFFPKKPLFFLSISDFQPIIFGRCIFFHLRTSTNFFVISFEARMSKLYSKCAEELFEEMINFEKLILFIFFLKLIKNLSAFYRKIFQRECK